METTFTLPEANTVKTISQLCEILNQCEELPVFWVEDVCANNSWELLEPSNIWDERDLCTDGAQYVTLDDNGEFNYYYNNEKA